MGLANLPWDTPGLFEAWFGAAAGGFASLLVLLTLLSWASAAGRLCEGLTTWREVLHGFYLVAITTFAVARSGFPGEALSRKLCTSTLCFACPLSWRCSWLRSHGVSANRSSSKAEPRTSA